MSNISYSTNWMGPISIKWYRDHGLTRQVWKKVESDMVEEIITYYAGGRIDIRGLDDVDSYNGWHEYSVPIMHGEDWNKFSDWLDDLMTDDLLEYEQLIEMFENDTGCKIRWWKY